MARAAPGPRNLITDVAGLLVGAAADAGARTGVTVILAEGRAVAAVDARGGAPGTRETDVLRSENLVDAVDGVVLAGGSVYGLAAADAVTAWLGARGRGYGLTPGALKAPIVPAAILFDLANGGDKAWGETPPYGRLGREAAASAAADFALGSVGAGCGAAAGALKGGLGSASIMSGEGFVVGAIAAVNTFGSVVAPGGRAFWAAPFEIGGEFGGLPPSTARAAADDWGLSKREARAGANTTIACVATDLALTPAQAKRVAIMAQDGLARAVRPAHTPFDGDVVFVLATGKVALAAPAPAVVNLAGSLAADCLARAIARGVYEATTYDGGPPAWRDL